MLHNMFDRLLVLFIAVILLITLMGGGLSIYTARQNMVKTRMDTLMKQAREIAHIAFEMSNDFYGYSKSMGNYLFYKTQQVYREYDAYIMIVNRHGRTMDNMRVAKHDNIEALETLDPEEKTSILQRVLAGEQIQSTINSGSGPIFTIAVPWMDKDVVSGAVFIHTSSQVIQAQYQSFLIQILVGFALTCFFAIFGATLYTKGIIKPLTKITFAAEEMAKGRLSVRAQVTGVNEVRQLAGSFNVMAEQLEMTEESRKEFVANVSHELRSPITSIHGFVEGILDGTIPQQEQQHYLQIISEETNRMKRLISDLLQLSRMDNGVENLKYSNFDINELICRVLIERMSDLQSKNIEPEINFYEEVCMVNADQDRISQVLHNIVDNAIKYLHNDGHLTIATSLVHDNTIDVVIQNDGDPISPEDRNHVFERFFMAEKAHTAGKGTGLGLSICKQIIEMHGQTIEVLPLDDGAGFRFTLSLAKKPEQQRLNPA